MPCSGRRRKDGKECIWVKAVLEPDTDPNEWDLAVLSIIKLCEEHRAGVSPSRMALVADLHQHADELARLTKEG